MAAASRVNGLSLGWAADSGKSTTSICSHWYSKYCNSTLLPFALTGTQNIAIVHCFHLLSSVLLLHWHTASIWSHWYYFCTGTLLPFGLIGTVLHWYTASIWSHRYCYCTGTLLPFGLIGTVIALVHCFQLLSLVSIALVHCFHLVSLVLLLHWYTASNCSHW